MKDRINKLRLVTGGAMVGMLGEFLHRVEFSIIPLALLVIIGSAVLVEVIINDN